MSLDALEKVVLARAHKVAKWLREGLREIASEEVFRSAVDLESQLGLRTAFRLLWILREKSLGQGEEYITLRSIGCSSCGGTLLKEDHGCKSCNRKLGLDDRGAVYCTGGLSATSDQGRPSKIVTYLNGDWLGCTICQGNPITGYINCPSCSAPVHCKKLRIDHRARPAKNLESHINEAFASEIAECEGWDQ